MPRPLALAALALAFVALGACSRRKEEPETHTMPDPVYTPPARSWGERTPATWAQGFPGVRWAQRMDTDTLITRVDPKGGVVLAASLLGTAEIGGRHVEARQGQDVLVARLDADGRAEWAAVFGGEKLDTVEDAAVDEQGFVTLTGVYAAPIAFGGEPLPTAPKDVYTAYLARLDPGGKPLAARGLLTPQRRQVSAAEGGALVTSGWTDFVVEMVDDHLAGRWLVRCERDTTDRRPAVARTPDGGALVAGDAGASTACGGVKAPKGAGIFLARIRKDGRPAWVKGLPGEGTFAGLAVSSGGRIAAGVNAGGESRLHLLDADGKELAVARLIPEAGASVKIAAVAIDAAGGAAVAGDFEGAVDMAGTRLVALARDALAVRLAPDGKLVWARRFGDESRQVGAGIAVDGEGRVVLTGLEVIRQPGDRSASDWFVLALAP